MLISELLSKNCDIAHNKLSTCRDRSCAANNSSQTERSIQFQNKQEVKNRPKP